VQQMTAQLDVCVAEEKVQDCKRLLHTLKGLAATLGAQTLSTEIEQAEIALLKTLQPPYPLREVARQAGKAILAKLPALQYLLLTLASSLTVLQSSKGVSAVPEALRQALERLQPLLVAGDLEAMNAMAEINHLFSHEAKLSLEPLQEAMTDMDFEAALNCCRALLVSSSDGHNTMQP
jgi:two-component system sensor histidine kinase/response regulator